MVARGRLHIQAHILWQEGLVLDMVQRWSYWWREGWRSVSAGEWVHQEGSRRGHAAILFEQLDAVVVLFGVRAVLDGVGLVSAGMANGTLVQTQDWARNVVWRVFERMWCVDLFFFAIVTAEYAHLGNYIAFSCYFSKLFSEMIYTRLEVLLISDAI